MSLIRMVALELRGQFLRQISLGVDGVGKHGHDERGQKARFTHHPYVVSVCVRELAGLHVHREWEQVGLGADPAGNTRADIRIDHTDDFQRRTHLHADAGSRVDGVNVPGHHRELACPQAEHRMSEPVDPISLNVGHGADSGKVEVTGNQGNGERSARHKWSVAFLTDDSIGRGPSRHGGHAHRPQAFGQQTQGPRPETRGRQWSDDRRHAPNSAA